jgi:uncharacterized protein YggU (UPF0235/DUF167 family)
MRIAVEAHPNARLERVELAGNILSVWVRARPVEGQANAAIEAAIARALNVRRRAVRLVGGATSRYKLVEIEVANLEDLRDRLNQA